MKREASATGGGLPSSRRPMARRNAPADTLPLDSPAPPARPAPAILPRLEPAKVSEVHDSYWRFAAERQRIFFERARGGARPWTGDPVLSIYKFTNAYRASDRASQYLIRRVIYRDGLPRSPREVFFRIILFKLFNKIETWEMLERSLGAVAFEEYSFARYDDILTRERRRGARIYSAAYVMPTGRSAFGHSVKHRNHLELLERMMDDDLPDRLTDAGSMREGFEMLRAYPGIGDFLAYQFVSDVNYSEIVDFSEMEFVVPGPGARDGLRKCFTDFGGFSEPDLIRLTAELQEREFERRGLRFESLWGRPLQLIDCQNLFCEIDKYARVAHPQAEGRTGRRRIKQKFNPNPDPIALFYPPKWGLNEKAGASVAAQGRERAAPEASEGAGMDFDRYQKEALGAGRDAHRAGANDDPSLTVAMLGLAGESGQLLSEYKKHLRDGDAHRLYRERVSEELGDLLWYIARVASAFDLELSEVAAANLSKIRNRWVDLRAARPNFDAEFPEAERLPRRFEAELVETECEGGRKNARISVNGVCFGATLTDNAYDSDGYRFHDVFHFAYAAVLGWSPVTRAFLRRKRKSDPLVDEVEDGGRAAVIEEGIAALAFDYARRHNMLEGVGTVDSQLLRTIEGMAAHLEVRGRTAAEWERAIIQGFRVWRAVLKTGGGRVAVDMERRRIDYASPSS